MISHLRVEPDQVWRTRLAEQEVDVLIGADAVTATSSEVGSLLSPDKTQAVVNSALSPSYLSVVDHGPDHEFKDVATDLSDLVASVSEVDALKVADMYAGNGTFANIALLGFAFQQGLIPVSGSSLRRAIELNGVAVEANLRAFDAGRYHAEHPDEDSAPEGDTSNDAIPVEDLIQRRAKQLREYADDNYADQFFALVEEVQLQDQGRSEQAHAFTRIAVEAAYRLMAIKDEYEVARLLTDGPFSSKS